MRKNKNNGITLIALVVTILVLLIIVGITTYILTNTNLIEQAKWSKFVTEFREIEEKVELYITDKEIEEEIKNAQLANKQINEVEDINKNKMPVVSIVSEEEKEKIKQEKTTLQTKMEELSQKSIDEMNIYWIDKQKIQTNQKSKYIIDIDTRQIYHYEGRKIFRKIWHTLDEGVNENGKKFDSEENIWEGWITLTLYYPAGATEKQWRLGEEGETRYDEKLMWKNYTGPITVRLTDVENVWIKYKINGKEQIVAPEGRIVVDIQPDSYYPTPAKDNKVTIKIAYEENAELKQYKIGNSDWMDYEGEFVVTENTIVEARARKTETISDNEGNPIGTTQRWGRDNVYIGNIGIEEENLPAPTIQRLAGTEEGEVAKIQITYPEQANKKIYKQNYGIEQQYTEEISVKRYRTYIIAYYYNAEGKRSKSTAIYINDTSTGETAQTPTEYTPNKPGTPESSGSMGTNPTTPSYQIPAPNISVSPTTVSESVQVNITVPYGYVADDIYYKIGSGAYQKYNIPITVTNNTSIKAYYITTEGENSRTAIKRINNIKQANMPYVKLEATPDPYAQKYNVEKVTVTITSVDADNTQYSYNGVEYTNYTEPITVTKNCRIYAKGTNVNGSTVEYIDITNIGNKAPSKKEKLNVQIQVSPEPELTIGQIEKATVTIEYDQNATGKYYKIGRNGALTQYTEALEIDKNTTIYAYAISENGYGETNKQIDNLIDGIAEPKIIATPNKNSQAQTVKIAINYDKNATTKRYKINEGSYTDYTGEIEITDNCTITAYNSNKKGEQATSTYKITNIVKTTTVVIDKGDYYIIKLNYPPNTTGREYKWTKEGVWKSYPEQGIMLIKSQYKDNILNAEGQVKIKIENEEGKKEEFKGDYYFITDSLQKLVENISMRWNTLTPEAPQIILNTTEPVKQAIVSIIYDDSLITKQYKIVKPDGTIGEWQNYTGQITINQNNTIIYARGQDQQEMWSKLATKKITNIDEQPPIIKVTADLDSPKQKVGIKVEVIDDVKVDTVMWAKGIQKDSYFNSQGNIIQNNSIFNVEENGYYTIYAKDGVGNTSIYTIQVDNIDKNAPNIDIQITPESTMSTEVKILIDYGDATTRQYKIGAANTTWSTYTGEISLTSNTVLSKGWKNEDNTVTIYARGTDSAGNTKEIDKKILSLDVDAPQLPVVNSNYGYPVLTEYGVQFDGETTITYDTRKDIDNYYSIDNGTTWQKYTGSFNMPGTGTIKAKSVKKSSGLEVIATRTISVPSDAIGPAAYDGRDDTYFNGNGNYYMYIDSSMLGKTVRINIKSISLSYCWGHIYIVKNDGTEEEKIFVKDGKSFNSTINIPTNATKIKFNTQINVALYEIKIINQPNIKVISNYPILTQYGINQGYDIINIDYFSTSVQRLYKINDGQWINYKNTSIKLEIGQTISAKGIDKYGNETEIVNYTSTTKKDAIGPAAYDGRDDTYFNGNGNYYMYIDSSMLGKTVRINIKSISLSYCWGHIYIVKNDGTEEEKIFVKDGKSFNSTINIPTNATKIKFNTQINVALYEIQPAN